MVNESENIIQCVGPTKQLFWKRLLKKEKSACHFVGRVAGNKVVRAAVSMAGFASINDKQHKCICAAVVILGLHLKGCHCKDVEECVKPRVCKHIMMCACSQPASDMCHQTIEPAHLKLQAAARLSVQHQHYCVSQGMNV